MDGVSAAASAARKSSSSKRWRARLQGSSAAGAHMPWSTPRRSRLRSPRLTRLNACPAANAAVFCAPFM
eukprot:2067515-Lingulodinium_polyedra.AAC.1